MHAWRSRLERWFTPMARRCPLSPNAISILALLLNITAAALFYTRHFLLAIAFIAIGGFADAFDGIVARVQAKSSRYGDFLDHFCDRVSDILLIAGWLLGNEVRIELVVVLLVAVMLNGYIGTQIEATWRERNYDAMGRGEFVLALIIYPIASYLLRTLGFASATYATLRIAEWMSLLLLAFALLGIAQRFALAARLEREGREAA
jgi:phosphatidylglycerophosphate synthase